MENFKNKKVLIFGLGLNDGGLGMAEFFLKQEAIVTITDGKTEEQLAPTLKKLEKYGGHITYHLGGHIEEDFRENDIIIRNPAVKPDNKWLEIAREEGKEIYMEMALFHYLCPCPIIGITGTRGKSTTSSLIYEFLKEKYSDDVLLLGNIGKSAIRELPSLKENNIVVLELSSFQLDGMREAEISPNMAVVTNIYEDHLNWHPDMDDYIDAKKNIFLNQEEDDWLFVNIDNDITSEFPMDAEGEVVTFSLEDPYADYYMQDRSIYEDGREIFEIKDLKLEGEHNKYNILAAISMVLQYGVEEKEIQSVLSRFSGVKGRQELVRELNGVRYYNDTTATSVEAMLAMFERFGKDNKGKIIMISGGVDKGLDYERIVPSMKEYVKDLVLFEGTASDRIIENIDEDLLDNTYAGYDNMIDTVEKAYELAEDGNMVILCPGASSFNMFANEFDRGDQYIEAVENLN